MTPSEGAAKLGDLRVFSSESLVDCPGLLVRPERLGQSARLAVQDTDAVVTPGQLLLDLRDRRVLLRQRLKDPAGDLARRKSLGRPAGHILYDADVDKVYARSCR